MKKPVFSAQTITLADGDVMIIDGLPVNKKFIKIISNLVEFTHSSSETLYEIVDLMMGMIEVNENEHRFSTNSAYILWYSAQLLKEHDLIMRNKEGGKS